MDKRKSVSVVMCTYNGELFLEEQLRSILNQSYPITELIIQDDGSTDRTWEILNSFKSKYPIIQIYRNKGVHGVNGNFISAMHKATSSFIAIADQDDIWELDKIENQIGIIGDCLLCSGLSRPFSTDNSFAHFDNRSRNVSLFRMLFLCLPGHTLLFRRSLLDKLPPIDHPIFAVSLYDAALCITAAAHDSIVFIDKVLVNFRRHASATTYNDYHRSLPSWQNALYQLCWGIRHYRQAKNIARPIYEGKLALLEEVTSTKYKYFDDAKLMMLLETQKSIRSLLRLQILMIKHHDKLFQTQGGGMTKRIRAALYPIMQLYIYHHALR